MTPDAVMASGVFFMAGIRMAGRFLQWECHYTLPVGASDDRFCMSNQMVFSKPIPLEISKFQ